MSEIHLTLFAQHSIDPIIFMRVLRAVFLVIGAVIMLFEPMACGGKNRVFHRLLSAMMIAGSWVAYTQARTRMALVVADPVHFFKAVPPGELFWPEFAYTALVGIVAARLIYDVYVYSRLHKFGVSQDCGRLCEVPQNVRLSRGGR